MVHLPGNIKWKFLAVLVTCSFVCERLTKWTIIVCGDELKRTCLRVGVCLCIVVACVCVGVFQCH